jgi:biopolymer transport protein ExbD
MGRFTVSDLRKQRPVIQMAPLIDVVFITLILFMTIAVYSQMESEINISVPKSQESKEAVRNPGEIIINVTREGKFIVNNQQLNTAALEEMLKKVSSLFPNQAVIIRADEKTYHQYVVEVLDTCARAEIWNVAFSTINEN